MNILKSKKFKKGSLSVLFTVIFVAAIILVNVIFNLVLSRFDVSVDLTDSGLYSIEQSSEDYLKTLTDKIDITITSSEADFTAAGQYYDQTAKIAEKMADTNGNISVKYVDLLTNPTFVADYDSSVDAGMIIVKSNNTGRYKTLTNQEYLSITYDETYAAYGMQYITDISANAEQALLSAIMSVTNVNPIRVAFVNGFGETANATVQDLLDKNAYIVETLDIMLTEEIDSEIDYLFIYEPTADYDSVNLDKIDKWLDNGGHYGKNLVYVPSTSYVETPILDSFLADWGISLGKGYLYQTDSNHAFANMPVYQVLELQESDYSTDIDTTTKMTYGISMRPITLLFDEYSNYYTTAILNSYDGAVLQPFDADESWTAADASEIGAYPVIAESKKVQFEGGSEAIYSRVFVFGGSGLLDTYFLSATQANNAEIMMNLFNVTSNKEETVTLTPKSFTMDTYEITSAQANTIALIFAIIIPVIIIVTGIIVWTRRRHR